MKIVLIGAGNVGFHLGKQLYVMGEEIVQVYSRKMLNARRLAGLVKAEPITEIEKVDHTADLYLVAVHDDAIAAVARQLSQRGVTDNLVAHTSGATPLTVFDGTGIDRGGIFYPLQTFSIRKEPVFEKIPFCIDAVRDADIRTLEQLAERISPHVHHLDDRQRAVLHVAAVFANNFTNHLYHIAADILNTENLSLELLMPLIHETVDKLKDGSPKEMQTGPARRNDEKTMNRHLALLENNPEYQKIYTLISSSIQNKNKV